MVTSPDPREPGGPSLGRYRILRKLGAGSMGTVYLARDERGGGEVALKVIRADRLSPEAAARLQEEFRSLAGLHHPRIAAAFDFGWTESPMLPFYTREHIPGEPLPPGPPAGAAARDFLRPILDLLDALEYLHAHRILHLDIHPGNLIVREDDGRGVLIDFGLLRSAEGLRRSVAETEGLAGLPPEVLGKGAPTEATDLFLAGRLLLYRLTGRMSGESRLPDDLPGLGPRSALEIERIAGKALQPDPARRFRSASEFRDALARTLGGQEEARGPVEPGDVTVGRERELARIEGALREAIEGRTAVLRLAGGPGLGKTRLLAEARVRAGILGLDAVPVSFFPDPGPGSPLLCALAGTPGRRRGPRWLEPLDVSHGGSPEERARRAARAFFDDPGKPSVLLLDDLDRADGESRVLAEALMAECGERAGRAESAREEAGARGLAIIATVSARPAARSKMDVLGLKPLGSADARRLLEVLARPLAIPEGLLRKAASMARGSPLRLRRIARAFRSEWGRAGKVPEEAGVPDLPRDSAESALALPEGLDALDLDALAAAAELRRPASDEELAAAVGAPPSRLRPRLVRLARAEVLLAARGRRPLYQLRGDPPPGLRGRLSDSRRREVHERVAAHLAAARRPELRDRENLARHRLVLGGPSGIAEARAVAGSLRAAGFLDRAVRLLEDALPFEPEPRRRFVLAEEASGILEENGDHRKGIVLLEPIYRRDAARLSPREGIRLRRRLGVHYHRSGRAEEALRIFEEARALADPGRDAEDLVFIDSELAELCILRGRAEEAEEACRRGFDRLEALRRDDAFRARMEMTLRASRGHLELRRMNPSGAREELRAALRMARRSRMPAVQAVILNNLGMAESQLNEFLEAERRFRGAEKLLVRAGELRPVIAIACNLAGLAAKRGARDEAHGQLERASWLARRYPGKRIEMFVEMTRGLVASLLGDAAEAIEILPRAVPLAREVGDAHLAGFGQFYLAEARMMCGRYGEALRGLRAVLESAGRSGPPVLLRMAHSRLLLLSALLGSARLAAPSRKALEAAPRTDLVLLEAWNDLALGLAGVLSGVGEDGRFRIALENFRALGVPAGERFARLGLLVAALGRGDRGEVEARLAEARDGSPETHRLLAVARPLVAAEAHAFLGNDERSSERLSEASGAIVGSPFLELDWRIELLRARLASRAGDVRSARENVHRALHARDLILQDLPPRARAGFLAGARFAALHDLASRLERSPRTGPGVPTLGDGTAFEGMVGRSGAMVRVFQEIDRLRGQEIPVLIAGETGTGKELVARALHRTSPRRGGPFFAIHCASLPAELFEAEFFGHEAGAFTGAEESRPGILETLRGGTLLLDEVGELPVPAQAKLLRVLDSGMARRLGGTEERPVDVRFLASTSADLRARIREGRFREDLYYRLGRIEVRLPPLRSRREDIAPLARRFLETHARRLDRPTPVLDGEGLALLESHPWPGNVRELEGALLRAVLSLSGPGTLGAREIEPLLEPAAAPSLFAEEVFEGRSLRELRTELDRAYVLRLFKKTGGDYGKMMKALGVRQSYFYSWLRKIGIDTRKLRGAR
jgi:serine/threonine-protein kinase PknK